MIVSASYRTDIPAYYADWFAARLRAGFAMVRNPYGGADYRVALGADAVDGFVFWTRNAAPFRSMLDHLAADHRPFIIQFTVTGYPRMLEAGVIEAEAAVAQLRDLARRFGGRRLIWRYDPIVMTDGTDRDWHRRQFARLAAALAESVDEVVISFAEIYRKSRRNLDRAGARHGFQWHDPDAAEKQSLCGELAACAADHGMTLSVCSQAALTPTGVAAARCIDLQRLGDVAGRPLTGKTKGNRPGCLCAESRDIGTYDSCPQGCCYCYAVADRDRAKAHLANHDPTSERL